MGNPGLEAVVAITEHELLAGAGERIERFRKADATIRVVTADGWAVGGAQVHIEEVRQAFLVGCQANPLLRYTDPQQEATYEREFAALMNYATLASFGWSWYEQAPGQTQAAHLEAQARWCKKHGIVTKGHPLIFHEGYPDWAPADAEEARQVLRARVADTVSRFAGLVDIWDVINEATVSARHDNGVGHWVKRDGVEKTVSAALTWAHAANPKATLLYNDWNVGPNYEALAQYLIDSKQPVDAFGIQSHMHKGEWPIERAWEVCETYSTFGKPLHFTELTVLSGEHAWSPPRPDPWPTTLEGEARQADYVEKLYTVLFSHPAVAAITWWDFADGAWLGAPAGLVRENLSPKPAYDRLIKLLKGQWWTRADLMTSGDGTAAFRGFLGRYRITVSTPARAKVKTMELRPGKRNTLTVKLD